MLDVSLYWVRLDKPPGLIVRIAVNKITYSVLMFCYFAHRPYHEHFVSSEVCKIAAKYANVHKCKKKKSHSHINTKGNK